MLRCTCYSSCQLVAGKCLVVIAAAFLQNSTFIKKDDIFEYARTSNQYKISNAALEKFKQLPGRTPSAVTVDKKVIYNGFYMPWIMSSTCLNDIIMAESISQNAISMTLGYPGTITGINIEDRRKNSILIATFLTREN
jgi:hypothetical protein